MTTTNSDNVFQNGQDVIDHPQLHNTTLDALLESDRALALVPTLALADPHTTASVDASWLTTTIAKEVPGAEVVDLSTNDAHDGMTSREKVELRWNDEGSRANLPKTLFVKATPEGPYLRETLSVLHMHEIEVNFYNQLQPENTALAPKAHYAKSHPGGRFLLVLEDLADRNCRPYWMSDDCSLEHARAVTIALANFHAKYWNSERLLSDLSWIRPRTRRFGGSWLDKSFAEGRKQFLDADNGKMLSADAADLLRLWDQHSQTVYQFWETCAQTALHGDTHLGNTFSYSDGRAGLFDWQVMFRGCGLRDLSSFMNSALTNENRICYQKELFELYIETLLEGGIVLNKQQAWDEFCLYFLDFWDAIIVTCNHGIYGHDEKALLRSMETTIGSLLDNDVMGKLKHLVAMKR